MIEEKNPTDLELRKRQEIAFEKKSTATKAQIEY